MERNNEYNSEREKIFEKIKENLDLAGALGGIFLGIFVISIFLAGKIRHHWEIAGTIIIASAIYILLRKRLLRTDETFEFKLSQKFIYLNNIIFFLALSIGVWLLYTTLYSRPLIYFILVAIACASISLEILYSNTKKWEGLILIKILLIGITLYGGIYYGFPGDIVGVDTRYHNVITEQTIEYAYIVPNEAYSPFPIFHMLAAQTSILTSLSVHDSIFSSITFLIVFSTIFVFLLCQKLINTKIGLLAALMLVVGDNVINFSSTIGPIPMSLGFFFFIILLYLVIISAPKPLHRRITGFFLYIVLVLTHTVASFILFVTTISLLMLKNINKYINNLSVDKFAIFLSTTMAFGVILLTYWMHSFQCPTCVSFFEQGVYSLKKGLTEYSTLFSPNEKLLSVGYVTHKPIEYILDRLGYLILLVIGIIGVYSWVKSGDEFKVPLAGTMVLIFALIYGNSVFGLLALLPQRWFMFVYVILLLVSCYGLFKLINLIDNKRLAILSVVIIIFLIIFFMITSTISNDDSPLYNKEYVALYGYKQSQLQGILTIPKFFNGTYGLIMPYTHLMADPTRAFIQPRIDPAILSADYNFSKDTGKMCVIRKDAFIYPRVWEPTAEDKRGGEGAIPYILDEEFKKRVELNSNKIYDNGEVWGYIIK